ncbi:beta-galactosidase [Orussus abietinus]|uniref:beta-galactosidase n=1 Tax=Orussus abietinus TaxID=222816 RepID=UPI00062698A3|nr:beta-galactosidase [Orussus abietinus]
MTPRFPRVFHFLVITTILESLSENVHETVPLKPRVLNSTNENFYLDGKKFHIYAEWATHEPKPAVYEWNGDANITRFIELAQKLDLFVIIRAGPFIDADRSLGGLPGWLLTINVSESREGLQRQSWAYRKYAEAWLSRLLPKLSKMLLSNGGPVIMVQIDSDIGPSEECPGADWLLRIFISYLGQETIFFTMDQNAYKSLFCGRIQGVLPGFRITPWEYKETFNESVSSLFSNLEMLSPGFPKLVELRTGTAWSWGGPRTSFTLDDLTKTLADIIQFDCSVILYMFAGGTNFERAGNAGNFSMGMITSYDYDALISESGELTDRYVKVQKVLLEHANVTLKKSPTQLLKTSPALYKDIEYVSLGSFLDPEVRRGFNSTETKHAFPLTFGQLGIAYGMVLYETTIPKHFSNSRSHVEIRCSGIRDRGYVYIRRTLVGILNHKRNTVMASKLSAGNRIQILVEEQGYASQNPIGGLKGIISDVHLDSIVLRDWTMSIFPISQPTDLYRAVQVMKQRPARKRGFGFYRAVFTAPMEPMQPVDGVLDVSKLGKGMIFLNGRNLGKCWSKSGPQQTLLIPGCFIRPHPEDNQIFAIIVQKQPTIDNDPETPVTSHDVQEKSLAVGKGKAYVFWFHVGSLENGDNR